jgi:hypothetical protein
MQTGDKEMKHPKEITAWMIYRLCDKSILLSAVFKSKKQTKEYIEPASAGYRPVKVYIRRAK